MKNKINAFYRFLFWTDLGGSNKIYRSRLDGSEKLVIANDLKDLRAIAVDRASNLLFFSYSHQIDVCNIEGQRRYANIPRKMCTIISN